MKRKRFGRLENAAKPEVEEFDDTSFDLRGRVLYHEEVRLNSAEADKEV